MTRIWTTVAPTSSQSAFTIVQPDSGTSPTATPGETTLTITSPDRSSVITGDSSTDIIKFTALGMSFNAFTIGIVGYSALLTDRFLFVRTGVTSITINLPNGASCTAPLALQDIDGLASTHPITLHPYTTDTINGLNADRLLYGDYNNIALMPFGGGWWF